MAVPLLDKRGRCGCDVHKTTALALTRQTERLRDWARRARAVGYFDEGYAAAQLWQADWEQYDGDALCERARAIERQLDPMRQA